MFPTKDKARYIVFYSYKTQGTISLCLTFGLLTHQSLNHCCTLSSTGFQLFLLIAIVKGEIHFLSMLYFRLKLACWSYIIKVIAGIKLSYPQPSESAESNTPRVGRIHCSMVPISNSLDFSGFSTEGLWLCKIPKMYVGGLEIPLVVNKIVIAFYILWWFLFV